MALRLIHMACFAYRIRYFSTLPPPQSASNLFGSWCKQEDKEINTVFLIGVGAVGSLLALRNDCFLQMQA